MDILFAVVWFVGLGVWYGYTHSRVAFLSFCSTCIVIAVFAVKLLPLVAIIGIAAYGLHLNRTSPETIDRFQNWADDLIKKISKFVQRLG